MNRQKTWTVHKWRQI